MKHAWIKTTLALAIGALSSHTLANGLAINEQSASGMGTAFAGRSSSAQDASTVFGNPAGMSKLERREFSGGVAVIHATTDIKAAGANAPGTLDGDMVRFPAVPFGYYVTPINEQMHFGLGIYVPFAVISDYEKTFSGRYNGLKSKVEVVNLQPTLSYKITDQVSVGVGAVISQIKGELTSNTNLSSKVGAVVADTDIEIEGDDIAYGFNAGVLIDLSKQLTWGLTYHSKVKYSLEGETKVSGLPNLPLLAPMPALPLKNLDGTYDASVDISMPESVDTSLTYRLDDQWTLYGGATWTRWSRLDALVINNQTSNALAAGLIGTKEEPLKWEDTWSFAVGAAYQLNPQWVLRAGLALDESPTNDAHRTARIPVADRTILSLGAGWAISQDLTLDVAYSYLQEDKGEVHQTAYNAEYENNAHGLGAQLSYRF